jgi:3-methyladenine DNA glycosylase AlkD
MTAEDVKRGLMAYAKTDDSVFLQRFFKTNEGQYGAGDVFIGVRVPQTRAVCRQYKGLPLGEVQKLLNSEVHECRLAALILLSNQYAEASDEQKQAIYALYLKNVYAGRVNNWDLVDVSVEHVIGVHLMKRSREVLFTLASSNNVWQRRVAMVSTFHFLKQGDPSTTLEIAEVLLYDSHDLIQKAVGWMLREMGKRVDEQLLVDFLQKHYKKMPRTMLRYAIERLSGEQRLHFMKR